MRPALAKKLIAWPESAELCSPPMDIWQLDIDESGEFHGEEKWSLVTGFLQRQPMKRRQFQHELKTAMRGLPYPYHATQANRLTGLLAFALLGGLDHLEPFSSTWSTLQAAPPHLLRKYRKSIQRERVPSFHILKGLDAWLKERKPGAYGEMRRCQNDHNRHLTALCQTLTRGASAHVVAAAVRGPGLDEEPRGQKAPVGRVRVDRYLSCLRALIERVALIAMDGTPRLVRTTVARRNVERKGQDSAALQVADVEEAIRAVLANPDEGNGLSKNQLVFEVVATPAYDKHVAPGVVLADLVSNRLFGSLPRGPMGGPDWDRLEKKARWVGVPVSGRAMNLPNAGPLPTVACDGAPRALLRDGLAGKQVDTAAIDKRWAQDQADRWLEASR